ncbi:MAG TPA: vWA domain-containing protein [Candidatus Acidoferrum sp.]|nr:vWA domain-containing protein [Candidatus Acidoferrum sp.]
MKRVRICLVAIALFLISAGPAPAQTSEVRTVPLAVLNSNGKAELNLTLRNIRIKEHGVVARKLTLDTSPRRIVLLLDVSGSMATMIDYSKRVTTWDDARNLAEIFLRTRFRQDLVALDVFAEEEKQIVPFTHDFSSVQTALGAVPPPKGSTNAVHALRSVMRELGPSATFGDAVVFVSDGRLPGRFPDSLEGDACRHSVRVFLLSARVDQYLSDVDPGSGVTSGFEAETDFMITTGGFSFAPESVPDIQGISELVLADPVRRVEALSNAIHGTYRLELQLERPVLKKQKLELQIIDDAGKSMRGVHALYPHILYPVADSKNP